MEILTLVSLVCGILIAVGSLVGAIFKFVIIQPLKSSIEKLADVVTRIANDIEESRRDRQALNIKVAKIDVSLASLEHRLEFLESKENHNA